MARKQDPAFVAAWAWLVASLAASLVVMRCEAQYPVAWDQPGKVGPESTNRNGLFQFDAGRPQVSLKDRPPFTTMAKQVFGILLAMPTLAQPRGFDVWTFGSATSIDVDGKTDSPRPHRVSGYMRVRMPVYPNVGGRSGENVVPAAASGGRFATRLPEMGRVGGDDAPPGDHFPAGGSGTSAELDCRRGPTEGGGD